MQNDPRKNTKCKCSVEMQIIVHFRRFSIASAAKKKERWQKSRKKTINRYRDTIQLAMVTILIDELHSL